jgi:hypothetical protein
MLDNLLVFEHRLRAHVQEVRADLALFLEEQGMSEYAQNVEIEYAADDGGSWKINHYHNRVNVNVRGAELSIVTVAFKQSFEAQHGAKTLRGLIAAS